jgi:hypothetical protein
LFDNGDQPPAEQPAQPSAEPPPEAPAQAPNAAPQESQESGQAPEATQPAPEQPPSDKPQGTVDDLFDDTTQKGDERAIAGGLASLKLRTWQDNTGRYSCEGRLIKVMADKVCILKRSGKISTVPLVRLSEQDLGFVRMQADAATARHAHVRQTSNY